jgi:hypothetical protein
MNTKDDKENSSIGIGIHWSSIFMSVRFVREFVLKEYYMIGANS